MSYICETIIITKSDFFWKKSRFHWNLSPKPEAGNIFQVLAVTKRSMPGSIIPFSNNSASIKQCSLHRKPRQQKNIIKIFLIFAMLFEKVCAVKPALIPTFHSSSGCKTKYCWKFHWFKALSSFTVLAIKKEKSTHKAQLPACALTFCPLNILYYIPGWLIHNTYLINPNAEWKCWYFLITTISSWLYSPLALKFFASWFFLGQDSQAGLRFEFGVFSLLYSHVLTLFSLTSRLRTTFSCVQPVPHVFFINRCWSFLTLKHLL